jgi:hypothetical protein
MSKITLENIDARLASIEATLKEYAPILEMAKGVATMKKAMEPNPAVKEIADVLKALPKDVVDTLGIKGINFDPKTPWAKMFLVSGKSISVKKTDAGLRLRLRDGDNVDVIKELTPTYNGLNKALLSLVE